jgi:hypothetical protein
MDHLVQSGLFDVGLACGDRCACARIDVNAGYLEPGAGEHGGSGQADIAKADYAEGGNLWHGLDSE